MRQSGSAWLQDTAENRGYSDKTDFADMQIVTRDQIRRLKQMPREAIERFIASIYADAYADGFNACRKKFEEDAVILTEDEAKAVFGEEAVEKVLDSE